MPVHLVCGIYGTLIVPMTNINASYFTQFLGVVAVGAFVSLASAIIWLALKYTIGLRTSDEAQRKGTDIYELGMEAYPDFVLVSKGSRVL